MDGKALYPEEYMREFLDLKHTPSGPQLSQQSHTVSVLGLEKAKDVD